MYALIDASGVFSSCEALATKSCRMRSSRAKLGHVVEDQHGARGRVAGQGRALHGEHALGRGLLGRAAIQHADLPAIRPRPRERRLDRLLHAGTADQLRDEPPDRRAVRARRGGRPPRWRRPARRLGSTATTALGHAAEDRAGAAAGPAPAGRSALPGPRRPRRTAGRASPRARRPAPGPAAPAALRPAPRRRPQAQTGPRGIASPRSPPTRRRRARRPIPATARSPRASSPSSPRKRPRPPSGDARASIGRGEGGGQGRRSPSIARKRPSLAPRRQRRRLLSPTETRAALALGPSGQAPSRIGRTNGRDPPGATIGGRGSPRG